MTKYYIFMIVCLVLADIFIPILIVRSVRRNIEGTRKNIAEGRKRRQAELSSKMYHIKDRYSPQGFAPAHARADFEKLYIEYAKFGMTPEIEDLRDEFYALPETK